MALQVDADRVTYDASAWRVEGFVWIATSVVLIFAAPWLGRMESEYASMAALILGGIPAMVCRWFLRSEFARPERKAR